MNAPWDLHAFLISIADFRNWVQLGTSATRKKAFNTEEDGEPRGSRRFIS